MRIERERTTQHFALTIAGRLDAESAGALESEFEEIIRSGPHTVLLDMQQIEYISSAGIRILIKSHKSLKSLEGRLSIVAASPMVREVLDLTGLNHLSADIPRPGAVSPPESEAATRGKFGSIEFDDHRVADEDTPFRGSLHGDPQAALLNGIEPGATRTLSLPQEVIAVGLGAMGSGFQDCKDRFGEFLAVAGAAVYRPTDAPNASADYMLQTGALQPSVEAVYAIHAQGRFGHCIRFEDDGASPGAPLSALVRLAQKQCHSEAVAVAMIAESAGLIGAALKRSPADLLPTQSMFHHPEIRQWLDFTPESAHKRALALVVGFAGDLDSAEGVPFMRPMSPGTSSLLGHFHACAFTYRAMPGGPLDLRDTVHLLFEEQAILDVMHLLNDQRDISGSGESLLKRGALWCAPLTFESIAQGGAQ